MAYTLQQIADGIGRAKRANNQAAVKELTALYELQREELYAQKYGAPPPKPSGFFENIGTGLASGFVSTYENSAIGAATLLEEEEELKARRKIKDVAESFRPDGGDKDSLTYKLASGVGSLGAFLPTALLGPGALLGAGALAVSGGAGEASERARAYGATEEERNKAAFRGMFIGATELIPLGKLSSKLKIPGMPDAMEKLGKKVSPETITGIRTRLQRAAATGVTEGAQEAAAAILQNLNEQGYNPEQVLFEAGVIEEGAIGGGAGAILQGVVDLLTKRTVRETIDDRGVTEEDKKPTSKTAPEETTEETPEETAATVTAEPATPVETKQKPKPRAGVETKISAFLGQLDIDKLEQRLANAEQEAKNAGLPVDTYELMVKSAIDKKKESADVGKQATGTPDTRATGDSIPSDTEVVGQQRTADTGDTKRPKQRRLDDSKRDTGRPVGGKKRTFTSLAELQKQYRAKEQPQVSEEGAKKLRKPKGKVIQYLDKDLELPQVNPKTDKLRYRKSKSIVESHSALPQDLQAINRLAGTTVTTGLSKEARKIQKKAASKRTEKEKKILAKGLKVVKDSNTPENTEAKVVSNYFKKFDSPMDAMYNLAYEIAEGGTTMKTPKETTLGSLQQYSASDPMKPYVTNKDEKQTNALGYKNAEIVYGWLTKNVSSTTRLQLANRIEEFKGKIAKEIEKEKTQEQKNKEALKRQERANKKAEKEAEEKEREERTSDAKEYIATKGKKAQVVARIDKEGTDGTLEEVSVDGVKVTAAAKPKKKKLSSQATQQQYFESVLANQKQKLLNKNVYKKAVEYAMMGTTPDANMKRLATAMSEVTKDTKAVNRILAKEKRERKAKKVESPKEKTIKRVSKKFSGKKGVTKRDILAAYRLEGAAYVKNATKADDFVGMAALYDRAKAMDYSLFKGDSKAAEALSNPISDKTMELLEENNISEALLEIAKEIKNPQLKTIANALSKNMGDTKVEFISAQEMRAKSRSKNRVFGMFEHTDNTIYLNEELPLDNHIIMHEAGHAGLDISVSTNPNSSYAKDITSLYEEMKDDLGTAYGKGSLREFMAEASSNIEFRKEIGGLLAKRASALSRFLRAVANFFRTIMGLETKVLRDENMTLDKLDAAIMEVMRPTPDFVNVRTFTNPPTPSLMAEIVSEQTGKAERDKTTFKQAFENKQLGVKALRGLTKVMHLSSLAEVARANGFGQLGYKLFRTIENGRGMLNQNKDIVEKAMEIHTAFSKEVGTDVYRNFNELIYNENFGATIYQVNPYKKRKDYEGKFIDGNNLADIWDAQQDFIKNSIPSKYHKKVEDEFNRGLAFYKQQYLKLKEALNFELKNVLEEGDTKAAKKVRDKMTALLFADGALDVYYPLVREGNFRAAFDAMIDDGKGNKRREKVFLMFKNISERDAFVAVAKDDPEIVGKIDIFEGDAPSSVYANRPDGSFVAEVLSTLKANNVSEKTQQEIMQMYINTLPETSFARSFTKRNGTIGFIKNAGIALETKGFSLAAQTAKIQNASEVRSVQREIIKKQGDLGTAQAKAIGDALSKDHADFAISGASFKTIEQYFKAANQFAFVYTLGFNVSSAIVNLSQIPLFVVPYLGARYGYERTINAFMGAAHMVVSSKASILENYNVEGTGAGAVYTVKESVKQKIRRHADKAEAERKIEQMEDLIPVVKEAHMRGKLYSWNALMEVGTQERATFFDKFAHLSALAFNAGERFNTQTTIIASYNLIREQMVDLKKQGKKYFSPRLGKEVEVPTDLSALRDLAAQDAMIQAQETNGGATLETTMPIAKEHVGRVSFMYKSYGVLMNTAMIKSYMISTDRYFKNNPEQKRIARNQLLGVHLSSLLLAGIGGMPIYGLISMIVDLFRDDDEDSADELTRKAFTEFWYKGPIVAATGADVAARIKLNDLIFQENRFMRDPSLEETISFYLGGPAWSTAKRYVRMKDDIVDGEYQRAFESFLPGGLSSLAQGYRYGTEGIQTRRDGDFIYEDITKGEIAAKVFGFAPAEYTFRQEQNSRNTRVANDIKEQSAKLKERYYLALRMKDYDRADDVIKDIKEFNAKYGAKGIVIDSDSIKASLKRHIKTSATMHNGVAVSPLYRNLLRQSNEEYKQY